MNLKRVAHIIALCSIPLYTFTESPANGSYQETLSKITDGERQLAGAELEWAPLASHDLSGAHMPEAHLRHADLTGADLSSSNLEGADLTGADLSGATLEGAMMSRAILENATLIGTELGDANLEGALLRNTYITSGEQGSYESGASVRNASFKSVQGLTKDQKKYLNEHGARDVPS